MTYRGGTKDEVGYARTPGALHGCALPLHTFPGLLLQTLELIALLLALPILLNRHGYHHPVPTVLPRGAAARRMPSRWPLVVHVSPRAHALAPPRQLVHEHQRLLREGKAQGGRLLTVLDRTAQGACQAGGAGWWRGR